MRCFLDALAFLTVIPAGLRQFAPGDLTRAAPCFPLVGAVLGALFGVIAYAGGCVLPPGPLVVLILAGGVLLTGGLHIDGLADTLDGIAARGESEKTLAVMKEGAAGPVGVLGLFFVYLFKYAALSAAGLPLLPALVVTMPLCGRWAIVAAGALYPPAGEGLGREFVTGLGFTQLLVSCVVGAAVIMAGNLIWPGKFLNLTPAVVAGIGVSTVLVGIPVRRIGGITGDLLGAVNEIAEVAFLLVFLLWPGVPLT
jgi:adenosylcobinamide-GDP ribazoletransferase